MITTPTPSRIISNHYVLQPPNPGQLRAVFPALKEATIDGQQVCAVPVSLDSARILENLGLPVPSPILMEYDWPGQFTPREYQRDTSSFLSTKARAYVLSGMGSGKTISSLWSVDYLQRKGVIKKALIVAPLSTLDPTWADEIFRNFIFKKFVVLTGSRERRKKLLAQDADIYIINHDGVQTIYDDLMARPDINMFVLDELAVYRNSSTKRWKTMNALVNKCGYARMVWGLTGAPTPNAPTDAFAQSKLVTPEAVRGGFRSFRDSTMQQVSQFRWVPRPRAEHVVHEALKPNIRYALRDCVDLPPTIYTDRHVELTPTQAKHYKELLRSAVTEIAGTQVTAVNAAVLIGKILQVLCGVVYGEGGENVKVDASNRISCIEEIIEGSQQKVIVFVPLTGALNAVAAELKKRWTVETVDGSTSINQRNRIFRDFQHSKDPHVLVANAGAMSHGLTLTEASTIIWYAPTNSNDIYNQANARIVRPGQKLTTNIVHIYATSEERKIYSVLKEKTKMQDLVLELARSGVRG